MHITKFKAGRLYNSVSGIRALIEKIEEARKTNTFEPVVDINVTFRNLDETIIDIQQIINEYEITFPLSLIGMLPTIKVGYKKAVKEYEELRSRSEEDIVKYEHCIKYLETACQLLLDIKSDYVQQPTLKMNYLSFPYIIPEDVIDEIFDNVVYNRPFTLLDVNCSDGTNIARIQDRVKEGNILLYAINKDSLSNRAAKKLAEHTERFIFGVEYGPKYISNKAFDMLLVAPGLTFSVDAGCGFVTSREESDLKRNMKYLREDGVLMFVIPKFRISREIAATISKNFTNVHIYETGEETQDVIITGSRIFNSFGTIDTRTYNLLRSIGGEKEVSFTRDKYILPSTPIEISTFRGGTINSYEMKTIYDRSTAFDALMEDNFGEIETTKKRHSILPFTVGQLGLILTSGCMDGMIEDEDGGTHLIKGRIIKKNNSTEEREGNKRIYTSTLSNHVEINAFLPTGELKTLN